MRWSLYAWLLSCAFITGTALWYPKWTKGYTEATLSWDVAGYYLYLPAALIYNDLTTMESSPSVIDQYGSSSSFYQAFQHPSGAWVMKYSAGLALAYSPFFAVAHTLAPALGYPADGFSRPYQAAIHWGSLLVAFWGLWLMRGVLRRYFSENTVALTLLGITLGTNYLNYAAIDAAMTHNYLFTGYALLVYGLVRWHENPRWSWAVLIGLTLGWMALCRPTEMVALLLPLFWGGKERFGLWRRHWPQLLVAAVLTASMGMIQLVYWKWSTGDWLVYSYQDQGFNFSNPFVYKVLFTYKKGWLVYTPLMAFALAGFYFLYRRNRNLFWPVFVYVLINFWVVSSWEEWWYGGSFGQRALVQSYALMAFPLAAWIAWTSERRVRLAVWLPVLVFVGALNLFQTWQAHGGGLDASEMNRAYYWRIFFNPRVNDQDRFLMDTGEPDYRGPDENLQPVWAFDSLFTVMPGEQTVLMRVDSNHWGQARTFFRFKALFFTDHREYDFWKSAQFRVAFRQEGQTVWDKGIRIHRNLPAEQWQSRHMDLRAPRKKWDEVFIYLKNPSEKCVIQVKDWQVAQIDEGN